MSATKRTWREQVDRGVELLKLCQVLQSEKDGVDRPEVPAHSRWCGGRH